MYIYSSLLTILANIPNISKKQYPLWKFSNQYIRYI